MQIPETPIDISNLDLMKKLNAFAQGTDSYLQNQMPLGQAAKQACQDLYSRLVRLGVVVRPLLDKVNSREMDIFTMHDNKHAMKVAHIMWHILSEQRRQVLTPPEIALLVTSAFLHDLGMFLSPRERELRLAQDSDIWDYLEIDSATQAEFESLGKQLSAETSLPEKQRIARQLAQAEDALLCRDTRQRHATRVRYQEIIGELKDAHRAHPDKIANIDSLLSFDGDSFKEKLIDICVSHNESEECLIARDNNQPELPRFPRDYPIGSSTADLLLVAAALRLADILDFDRERTPFVVFLYFLPKGVDPEINRSVLEWEKHLSIRNWHIENEAIVFRAKCNNHIVHHAIVNFCLEIEKTISATKSTCFVAQPEFWPFALPTTVRCVIQSEGYRYLPYRFELDDERIYSLLMSGAIYAQPLDAVRELVQNAIDACKLRDALTKLHAPENTPSNNGRILVEYVEPTAECQNPVLSVRDTGTGMDELILTKWFLKVGRSYYNSSEFATYRAQLRKARYDFAPVSEFGIGFLSCFLLGDRVFVETAMWESIRGDTKKRTLEIHGPTRLIRLIEDSNLGIDRLRGTKVRVIITRGSTADKTLPASYEDVETYLRNVCVDLPYALHLRHVSEHGTSELVISPIPLAVQIPPYLEDCALHIPVSDDIGGIEGEIVLLHPHEGAKREKVITQEMAARLSSKVDLTTSVLIRGGFSVGYVPGLPNSYRVNPSAMAVLRMNWESQPNKRFQPIDLARQRLAETNRMAEHVVKNWMQYLLHHVSDLPKGLLNTLSLRDADFDRCNWLEQFDALTIYTLAANGWHSFLAERSIDANEITEWENSNGKALPREIFATDVSHLLLDLILPPVCKLLMGAHASFYLCPPTSGWRDRLLEWKDYISNPVSWGAFVEYFGSIENLLFYEYPGSFQLNENFRDRIESGFRADELPMLISCLDALADSRKERQVIFTRELLDIANRAQANFGELKIGNIYGTWSVGSFKLPELN